MAEPDIRWIQRFDNFQRALMVLERGVQLALERDLSELEQQGLFRASNSPMSWPGTFSRITCNIRGLRPSPVPGMQPGLRFAMA